MGEPVTGDQSLRLWWRRNGLPLLAIAALAPLTWFTITAQERADSASGFGEYPVVAEAGSAVDLGGIRVGPATAELTTAEAAPAGTHVVRVTLPVRTGGKDLACSAPVLREIDGLQREWKESSYDLGYDLYGDAERIVVCPFETVAEFTMTLLYLVPDDADGPFFVDMSWVDVWPDFARIGVEAPVKP